MVSFTMPFVLLFSPKQLHRGHGTTGTAQPMAPQVTATLTEGSVGVDSARRWGPKCPGKSWIPVCVYMYIYIIYYIYMYNYVYVYVYVYRYRYRYRY